MLISNETDHVPLQIELNLLSLIFKNCENIDSLYFLKYFFLSPCWLQFVMINYLPNAPNIEDKETLLCSTTIQPWVDYIFAVQQDQ